VVQYISRHSYTDPNNIARHGCEGIWLHNGQNPVMDGVCTCERKTRCRQTFSWRTSREGTTFETLCRLEGNIKVYLREIGCEG
jgi:hypothetical protein